jgi:hypothetical protein
VQVYEQPVPTLSVPMVMAAPMVATSAPSFSPPAMTSYSTGGYRAAGAPMVSSYAAPLVNSGFAAMPSAGASYAPLAAPVQTTSFAAPMVGVNPVQYQNEFAFAPPAGVGYAPGGVSYLGSIG